jgi:predicted anti-sigma-YlaC factor YlaD
MQAHGRFHDRNREEAMPAGLKVVIVLNLVGALAILGVAASLGGGFTSGVFPADIAPTAHPTTTARMSAEDAIALPLPMVNPASGPPELRPAYWATDPAPRPWDVLSDGSIRFRE